MWCSSEKTSIKIWIGKGIWMNKENDNSTKWSKEPHGQSFCSSGHNNTVVTKTWTRYRRGKGSSMYSFFDHGWCWSQILQLTWDCWSFMNTGGEETNKYVCDNCTKYVCSEHVVIVLKGFFTFNVRRITLFDNSLYEPFFSRLLLILNSIKRI